MGVTTATLEFTASVPASRMFKALADYNLLPKLMPQVIKSVQYVQGDGEVGSIKQIDFAEGAKFKYARHRIDAIDVENCTLKYTVVEGDILSDKLESIVYEIKCESSGAGCVVKTTNHYHTKEGMLLEGAEVNGGKDEAISLYKAFEDYLLANPNAYA